MSKSNLSLLLAMTLLVPIGGELWGQTVPPGGKEQVAKLAAMLKSESPLKEKADACRQLAIIGTKDAVPALAALLGDEKLSHMARYGLEPIPDPSVDEALRQALAKLKGRALVGVIGSLGVRRDAQAIAPLKKLLNDADADVAQAAARALGSIGTREAAKALQDTVGGVSKANQLAFCEGLFRCAEHLCTEGQCPQAQIIYDQLRRLPAAHQVRAGALYGAIMTRGKGGLALLQEHLHCDDYVLFAVAVRTAQELSGVEVTKTLTDALAKLPADRQILVIRTLAKRADASALPTLFVAAKSGAKPVRLAAIQALPPIADASAVPVLVGLLADSDQELVRAAREALGALPVAEADQAVMKMFASKELPQRQTALELIGRRRMSGAIPTLLKAAAQAEAQIRPVALKRLGELGSPKELPAVLDLLMATKESRDLSAAEQAASAICAKADDPEACVAKLIARLPQAPPAQKIALLNVLGSVGGANALQAVRAAVKDDNRDIHVAAIRTLGAWKTADAVPDLLALAQTPSNATDKMLGLRGYLRWAGSSALPAQERLAMCQKAAELTQKPEEKKLLLAALGSIDSPEALQRILPYLEESAIQNEAVAAAVAITQRLLKGRGPKPVAAKLIVPLEQVVQKAANANLKQQAQKALRQAKSKVK